MECWVIEKCYYFNTPVLQHSNWGKAPKSYIDLFFGLYRLKIKSKSDRVSFFCRIFSLFSISVCPTKVRGRRLIGSLSGWVGQGMGGRMMQRWSSVHQCVFYGIIGDFGIVLHSHFYKNTCPISADCFYTE